MGKALKRYHVKCHAYVLMTNHVHLLLTPEEETGISKVLSLLGQHYVQYINRTYRRSGTLWEGRHKASMVNADEYLLMCYRYIELNPVRAGMTAAPEEYRWSSYRHHAWGEPCTLIQDHHLYLELGREGEMRQHAYRELFRYALPERDVHTISRAFHYNYPLGNERFKQSIEETLQRQVGYDRKGRPGKHANAQN